MQAVAHRVVLRLPRFLLTVLVASTATFFLVSLLPGNPALLILDRSQWTPKAIKAVNHQLGLDEALPLRYVHWLDHLVHGQLGYSYLQNGSVSSLIGTHFPASLELMVMALLIALVLAIPLGIIAAYRSGRPADHTISSISFGLLAVPGFVLALLLIYVFADKLRLLPATGWVALSADPLQNMRYAILPALTLALPNLAVFTRLLRNEMISTLQEEYIAMGRAKGLSTRRILLVHALKPSSLSLVTVVGIQVGVLISGTVIVEYVFGIPGIGLLLITAINNHDYPLIQGLALFAAVAFAAVNFVVDLIYAVLDPRIRRRAGA